MQFIKDNGVFVKSLIENALKKNAKAFFSFTYYALLILN